MSTELYKVYRPSSLKAVAGQTGAVKTLEKFVQDGRVPHAMLFCGPSGTGKTTLARILAKCLKCGDLDLKEINSADFRGIEMVRDVRQSCRLAPIQGKTRVYIIDECQKLTHDAQSAFLKLLEDTPKHAYFFLCTTDPEKLIATVRGRCTPIALKGLTVTEQKANITRVLDKEGVEVGQEVVDKIIELAEGSARKALVLLDQVLKLDDDEDRLLALQNSDVKVQAIQIARALLDTRTTWPDMAKILKEVNEEPESLRHMVLAYATTIMLSGSKQTPRAHYIIQCFRDHWYDCKRAGLVASCYDVVTSK